MVSSVATNASLFCALLFYSFLAANGHRTIARWTRKYFDHPTKPSTGRVDGELDTVRAIAILLVVLVHLYLAYIDAFAVFKSIPLISNGWIGVEIFVVLSGYLVYGTLRHKSLTWAGLLFYSRRRFFRIYPVYFVTTLVGFAFAFKETINVPWYRATLGHLSISEEKWIQLIEELLMLRALDWRLEPWLNQVNWSLAVEVTFYLLLPVYVLVSARARFVALAVVLSVCILIKGLGDRELGLFYFFWIGIALYELRHYAAFQRLPTAIAALIGVLGVVVLALFLQIDFYDAAGREVHQRHYRNELLAVALTCMFVALFRVTTLKSVFKLYPARFIGIISYSVFLWHLFLLEITPFGQLPKLDQTTALIIAVFYYLPALLFLGGLSFLAVERPFMRRKGRA